MDGRRACLSFLTDIPSTAHAGLWLDKYLPDSEKGKGGEKAGHFKQAVRAVDSLYGTFYERWQQSLADIGAKTHQAHVLGRLSIGLGGESVLETSISLHRTYGVPYIPGSALKGLAASYTRKRIGGEWGKDSDAYKILFGDVDVAGYVSFYDALYIPGTAKANIPLALDVINVHHPEYYRGEKDAPPADWDSPTPISFLSATGSYLIALHGPDEWVKAAFEILAYALKDEGIGAKTSSGYGRIQLDTGSTESAQAHIIPGDRAIEPYALAKKRLLTEKLPPGRFRGTVVSVKGSYGFINPAAGGGQEFVHVSQIRSGQPLREGQVVEYRIGQHKGKPHAQDVEILLEPDR